MSKEINDLQDYSYNKIKRITYAGTWDIKWLLKFIQIYDFYQRKMEREQNKVLDVGCGGANFLKFYYEHFRSASYKAPQYTGIDLNEKYIDKNYEWLEQFKSRKVYDMAEFVHGNVTKENVWNEVDEEFDVILFLEAIEHLPEDKVDFVLRKISNKLSDNGVLFISTPVHYERNFEIFRQGMHKREYYVDNFKDKVREYFEINDVSGTYMDSREFKTWLRKNKPEIYEFYKQAREKGIFYSLLLPIFDTALETEKCENMMIRVSKKED